MNNTNPSFDPITGQPLNNTIPATGEQNQVQQSVVQGTPVETNQVQQPAAPSAPVNINQIQQIQNIPTIEQSQQQFIDNTQAQNTENNKEKKEGINYTFLIILFVIMFGAIFFLFPFLLKYI